MTTNKPQLHISMLDMMSRCGIQFQRRYGARFGCALTEEILPPGIALATGITVHKTVEANLKKKIESKGILLDRQAIADIARDEFQNIWSAGMMLTEDEVADLKRTYGQNLDQTIALSLLHHDNLAPKINPVAVEEKFVITLKNYPYDLAGNKDIREEVGSVLDPESGKTVKQYALRDTKTKDAAPPVDAAKSMQMAMYALSEKVAKRGLPKKVSLDFLIKTKKPKIEIREAVPDDSWIEPLFRRIERACEIIQSVKEGKGFFTPASTDSNDWVCREAYCGFAHTCPYWSGK